MFSQFTLAQSYSDNCQEDRVEYFRKKLSVITAHGHLSLAIALGMELGLFEALAKAGTAKQPATALDVARHGGFLKPRYCFEWLCCMACGGIIEVDETGQKFYIPAEHRDSLTGPDAPAALAFAPMVPMNGSVFKHVAQLFANDGPNGLNYSLYSEFYAKMETMSVSMHKKHLVKDFIPQIHMKEQLDNGIQVLDIGCGGGFHMIELASHFPNSHFIGIDIGPTAIRGAKEAVKAHNLKNVEFVCANAAELDAQWTERFQLITIFDACHDQCRPDLALRQAHRCLTADGLFAMLEVKGYGNCHTDKHLLGAENAATMYAVSLFHCLPVGSNSEDALQLGSMWGMETGKLMLHAAGFEHVEVEDTPYFQFNVLYKARKSSPDGDAGDASRPMSPKFSQSQSSSKSSQNFFSKSLNSLRSPKAHKHDTSATSPRA